MKKMLNIVTIISGIFVIFCYGIFFFTSFTQGSDLSTLILGIVPILAALITIIFRKKIWTWLRWILCIGMCFYMISFAFFCVYLFGNVNSGDMPVSDSDIVVMVYGCRTYNTPSKALRERLDAALTVLNDYPDSVCVVTGGQGSNEPITEAESMRTYLIQKGIDESRIYIEDKASSTVENIEFTKKLIDENGLSQRIVIGVSSDYHLRRIRILCDTAGFNTVLIPAKSKDFIMLMSNLTREYMSFVKMFVLHI